MQDSKPNTQDATTSGRILWNILNDVISSKICWVLLIARKIFQTSQHSAGWWPSIGKLSAGIVIARSHMVFACEALVLETFIHKVQRKERTDLFVVCFITKSVAIATCEVQVSADSQTVPTVATGVSKLLCCRLTLTFALTSENLSLYITLLLYWSLYNYAAHAADILTPTTVYQV